MEVRLVPYSESLKEEFDVFYCLDSMSKYEDALRLYEKAGFRRIERYNDNVHADVFMRLDL